MTSPNLYLLAFSLFASTCTVFTFSWAYGRRRRALHTGYAISACFAFALVALSVSASSSEDTDFEPAINAFLCLFISANPLIQSVYVNYTVNKDFYLRYLFKESYQGCFLKKFRLSFEQYVFLYACMSCATASTKCAVAIMLANSYKSDIFRVVILFVLAVEYLVPAPMFFKWTFRKLRYQTFLTHFGCYTFTACGFLVLAITATCYREAEIVGWCFWMALPLTSVTQCWLSAVHEYRIRTLRNKQHPQAAKSGKLTDVENRLATSSYSQAIEVGPQNETSAQRQVSTGDRLIIKVVRDIRIKRESYGQCAAGYFTRIGSGEWVQNAQNSMH